MDAGEAVGGPGSGIEFPFWGLVLITIALLAIGAVIAAIGVIRSDPHYRPLPGWPSVRFGGQAPPTNERMDFALRAAADALDRVWQAGRVASTFDGLSVQVNNIVKWEFNGQMIAGQTWHDSKTVIVGIDLAALLHELAHLCEYWIDGRVDDEHAEWESKGIRDAERLYLSAMGLGQ